MKRRPGGRRDCGQSRQSRKSRAGRGAAAPEASDCRAFPPGGASAAGGAKPTQGLCHYFETPRRPPRLL